MANYYSFMAVYYKMPHILPQNATAILLQNLTAFYYKKRQVLNCDIFITKCNRYWKMRHLLKIATVQVGDTKFVKWRRFYIHIKPPPCNTQYRNKIIINAKVIAWTKIDIQYIWNSYLLLRRYFTAKGAFLHGNTNLEKTWNYSLSNHVRAMIFFTWNTFILQRVLGCTFIFPFSKEVFYPNSLSLNFFPIFFLDVLIICIKNSFS